jgi:hypothetical protein
MPEAAQVTEVPVAPPPAAPAAAPSAPAPAESASATPEGSEPKPVTPDPAEKRGQSRFERRISRLVREAAEARAEANLYRRQLDEAKPKEQSDPGEPKLEQFKDIEEYANAKAEYAGQKALKSHQEKQTSAQQQARVKELTTSWETKITDAEGKYDDFEEVVGEIKPTSPVTQAIMEADNGADIAYYLGKNPEEIKRILKLSPLSQVRAIGRLEAKLAAEPPKPQTPSKAPAPITPLTGAATVASSAPSEEDDMRTWFRKRQKQVHGARK